MRRFRPCRRLSTAWLFRPIKRQRFLNLRTYVRVNGESGALFLWGWLSRPLGALLPPSLLGLPCAFTSLSYEHEYGTGHLRGTASKGFGYNASLDPAVHFEACPAGSLAEFAMERYTGFFLRSQEARVFRAWHPPWLQAPIEVTLEDINLVTARFPWFRKSVFAGAHFAPGFQDVWLGRPHRLSPNDQRSGSLHAL
jgi:uncharacterized protein YqjF (DUF2071 family)